MTGEGQNLFGIGKNGVLFLKLAWFVRPDINTGWPLFLRGMTRAMPSSFHLNNGRARVYIGSYKQGKL